MSAAVRALAEQRLERITNKLPGARDEFKFHQENMTRLQYALLSLEEEAAELRAWLASTDPLNPTLN